MAGITQQQRTALNKVQAKVQDKMASSAVTVEKQKLADMDFTGQPTEVKGPFIATPRGNYISEKGRACFTVLDAHEEGFNKVWIKVSDIWDDFDLEKDQLSSFHIASITLAKTEKAGTFFCNAIELA